MPTRTLKRRWCKTCASYEFFEQQYPNPKDWFCKICENAYEEVDISQIPEELKIEQRKRYIDNQRNQANSFFEEFLAPPEVRQTRELIRMFSPPGVETEYEEDDAGQIEIDRKIAQERAKKREEERLEREEVINWLFKYKGMGRNDICPCNSGKKYKKCCLFDVEKKLIKYHLRF